MELDPSRFDLSDRGAAAFCPACGSGYRAGFHRCAACAVDLVPRSEIEQLAARREEPRRRRERPRPETPPPAAAAAPAAPGPPVVDVSLFNLKDPDAAAFCPSCGYGFRAGFTRCAGCATDLLPRSEVEALLERARFGPAAAENIDPDAPVALAMIGNPILGGALAAHLESAGIRFAVLQGGALQAFGDASGPVEFYVPFAALEQAREILEALLEGEFDDTGEEVEWPDDDDEETGDERR